VRTLWPEIRKYQRVQHLTGAALDGIDFALVPVQEGKAMISTMVRTLSRVPISLRGLAVCVACEECFELGDPTCPSCGSDEYVPLLHQLEGRILNMTSNN
jgi:rRNA maturation endonuclease Nob1